MKYKILGNRVKLIDSYLIRKADFSKELNKIRNLHPVCFLWFRSDKSIQREWGAHNLAYALGINRKKTKDADLNFEQKWYEKLFYFVIGSIALLVIK